MEGASKGSYATVGSDKPALVNGEKTLRTLRFLFGLFTLIALSEVLSGAIFSTPEPPLSLDFFPKTVASMSNVTVTWRNIPHKELSRKASEYVCLQDNDCSLRPLSVWLGAFISDKDHPKGQFEMMGPQPFPANAPWLNPSPIKWKPITKASGSTVFTLHHHRAEVYFALFTNGTTYPVTLSISAGTVNFTNTHLPEHFHIAHAQVEGAVTLMFETKDTVPGMNVKWGYSPTALDNIVPASGETFGKSDLRGAPAATFGYLKPPVFYRATLSGLKEQSRVYYSVGTQKTGFTDVKFFKAPKKANPDSALKILAIADMGVTYVDGSQYHWPEPLAEATIEGATKAWLRNETDRGITKLSEGADVALLVGDLSYATGYQAEWDYFMTRIEPLASQVPFMTGQGNHERDCPGSGSFYRGNDSGGECGVPTQKRFHMPTGSQDDGWYSFKQGPVHFLMMNTEMDASEGTKQYQFIQSDLAAVNRTLTPWIIFCGHRPMYSTPYTRAGINKRAKWWPAIEDLLVKHHVQLALYGHVHNAEVTCPMYRGKCIKKGKYRGPVHAIIGNAGQGLTPFGTLPPPEYSMWRYEGFGYSTIEVDRYSLRMNFYADAPKPRSLIYSLYLHV